jgi:hypothetical protein
MDWLSKHKGIIDCAKKSVKLTAEGGEELEFVADPLVPSKAATNRVQVNQMEAPREASLSVGFVYLRLLADLNLFLVMPII